MGGGEGGRRTDKHGALGRVLDLDTPPRSGEGVACTRGTVLVGAGAFETGQDRDGHYFGEFGHCGEELLNWGDCFFREMRWENGFLMRYGGLFMRLGGRGESGRLAWRL